MWMVLRVPYLAISVFFVVALYMICAVENYNLLQSSFLNWLVYEEILNTGEDSFLEIFSAVLWLLAFFLFSYLLVISRSIIECCWLAFYALISLFAFGEEISWGHHLFDYSDHVPMIVDHNSQGETNLHNINLAKILGVSEDFPYYRYLANFSHLLNPLFYLFLSGLWFLLPLLKKSLFFSGFKVLRDMPIASNAFLIFFFLHSVLFIVVDVVLFNVGYIYEMYIGLAALIVGLDIFKAKLNANM